MTTIAQHDRDHARIDAAWDAWTAAGKPTGRVTDAAKRQARRTLGLRIQAHMAVYHQTTLPIGWSYATTYNDHKTVS